MNWLPKALDPGEFEPLLDECKRDSRNPERDSLALVLMHDAGLRVHEACGLPLHAINPQQGLLRVVGKGGKPAVLPTSLRLLDHYDAWLDIRPDIDGPWLLCSNCGAVNQSHYRRLLARIGPRALGKHVHPHMLRHTILTDLAVDKGVPLPLVQQFGRHANIATTGVYLQVRPTWAANIKQILDS